MTFFQTAPTLGNQFDADRLLQSYLERTLSKERHHETTSELRELGELTGGELFREQIRLRTSEPKLTQWDAWGKRIDEVEQTPYWKMMAPLAAKYGLVASGYERRMGREARLHQFALVYLFDPASEVYSCPLAMTDGAAKTLLASGNQALIDRAVPRLTTRDPSLMWTSGQWMTERTGGSDVGTTETVARAVDGGYRLYGTKWFTSAVTSQMSLGLARPEGNPNGGRGLALFYVELRNADGTMNGIHVNRLKEKLGTRMLPTAELELVGARAEPVMGLTNGVKAVTTMLNVTRTWNAVCAVAQMRRGIALAKDYAKKRTAFGSPLSDKPLHVDTLATIEAEYEGAFLLAFRVVELLGKEQVGELAPGEADLLRWLTPIAKLTTGKQAVRVTSEVLEAFAGAGYVEDTGIPKLLRDAQVLPIWEGTTNVLSLDLLRTLERAGGIEAVEKEVYERTAKAHAGGEPSAEVARNAVVRAREWSKRAMGQGPRTLEAGARRFALTLGYAIELALLLDHGIWCEARGDRAPLAAARRLARGTIDHTHDDDAEEDCQVLVDT